MADFGHPARPSAPPAVTTVLARAPGIAS